MEIKNVEKKIEYWSELWEDLIRNFLKKSYGLRLYTPHTLIEDIIVEITENDFRNADNKKYFYDKICNYLEKDEVIKSKLKSEFSLLRKSFGNGKSNYILALCKKINIELKKGIYFKETLLSVEQLILNDSELDLEFVKKINYNTQVLIVEFLGKNYDLSDINKFLKNIFCDYHYFNELLTVDFPHGLKNKDLEDSDSYDERIKAYMDKLTYKERIQKLSYYYHKKTESVKYIFKVNGLKGNIEKKILGVTFYNIKEKRFQKDFEKYDYEDLQKEIKEKYIQAAVDVDYLLPKSSLKFAKTKIENALDILSVYFNFKTEVYVNDSQYVIINSKGESIFSSFSRDKNDQFANHNESLDLKSHEKSLERLKECDFLFKNETDSDCILKLKNALHWYRKGVESIKDEDKILNYWISIENFFSNEIESLTDILHGKKGNKFKIIQEIVSDQQVLYFTYNYGWELHSHYKHLANSFFKNTEIPEELLVKGQLKTKPNQIVYLNNFIEILPELKKFEKNLLMQEKINSVIDFYTKPQYLNKFLKKHIIEVKNDLLMIFRFRNLIVHNAHFNNKLLPYFAWKAKSFSGGLIMKLIRSYEKGKDINDLVFDIHIQKETFFKEIEFGNINLFKKP
ncbi:hypothetical protein [Polaribacter sp.]|uniref:hypothetical protein n=1 Tax=Polaribacter sp. TaxID=1920175 RepID=UPI003F6C6FCE